MYAACAVFEGKIIVSGGYNNAGNTVESYDVKGDRWSPMPSMINGHYHHYSVAVKGKLFVVDYYGRLEVFDNNCKKFVALKPRPGENELMNAAYSIGGKIVLIRDGKSSYFYDVDTGEWSDELHRGTEGDGHFACARIPFLNTLG